MRERLGAKLLWTLNLVVLGASGLLISLGHLRWGFGRILGRGGGCFLTIPNLSREMGPRSNFGRNCAVWRDDPRGSFPKFI
jgi:hypothetical protein